MQTLGVAIIGCGGIAKAHIEAYQQLSQMCEIRALCDIYPHKMGNLKQLYSLENVFETEDYHQVLNRPDIQLVSICLPPSLHCQVSVDSLKAGKHVLCEKPMAPSLSECDLMIQAEKESGRKLSIVAQNRFKTDAMHMKTLLSEGLLGKVLLARVNSMWWRGSNYYDLWWRGTYEKEGGGCTLNHAVHQIDILLWLLGMPESVYSVMANVAHTNSEVEDLSLSILSYEGMLAQVDAALVDHDEKQEFFFACERASVGIPWMIKACKQRPNGFFDPNPQQEEKLQYYVQGLPILGRERHAGQIENVMRSILEQEDLLVTSQDGRNAVELISAMYKSATLRQNVVLPLQPDDPFYTQEGMLNHAVRYHKKLKSVDNLKDAEITL